MEVHLVCSGTNEGEYDKLTATLRPLHDSSFVLLFCSEFIFFVIYFFFFFLSRFSFRFAFSLHNLVKSSNTFGARVDLLGFLFDKVFFFSITRQQGDVSSFCLLGRW
jgi:hypothetical protein